MQESYIWSLQTLQYADESLRKDREIVMAAVEQDDSALEYASEELQNNQNYKNLLKANLKKTGASLPHTSNGIWTLSLIVIIGD